MNIDFSIQNQIMHASSFINNTNNNIGKMLGQQVVVVSSPLSLLADAAEELTFSIDNTKELELKERKEKDNANGILKKRVELYKELMHQLGQTDKMNMLKKNIQSMVQKEQILKEVFSQFPDYTDAYVLLELVYDELNDQDNSTQEVKNTIKESIDELVTHYEKEINLGLHGALSALGYEDLGSTKEIRDFYRKSILDFHTVKDTFMYVQEKFGNQGFSRAMDYLFSTLSLDINSLLPSIDKTQLEFIYNNLGKVRLLHSSYEFCEELVNRWEQVYKIIDNNLSAMNLLSSLITFGEIQFLSVAQIETVVQKANAPDIEKEVLFLQDFINMVKKLPENMYSDNKIYQNILDSCQKALDKAIEREDEYLASLE